MMHGRKNIKLYYSLTQTASAHRTQSFHPCNVWQYLDLEQHFLIFESNLYLWHYTFIFFYVYY